MMDYGKFRYQQRKKTHGPKKHTVVEIKEVKMSVFFRGREITHPELGRQALRKVVEQIQDIAKVDIEPRLEGRNMAMLLTPK